MSSAYWLDKADILNKVIEKKVDNVNLMYAEETVTFIKNDLNNTIKQLKEIEESLRIVASLYVEDFKSDNYYYEKTLKQHNGFLGFINDRRDKIKNIIDSLNCNINNK